MSYLTPEIVSKENASLSSLWMNMEIISQINVYTNVKEGEYGCGIPGNLVTWSGYSWEHNEILYQKYIKEKRVQFSDICNAQKAHSYILVPVKLKQHAAAKVCIKLGRYYFFKECLTRLDVAKCV